MFTSDEDLSIANEYTNNGYIIRPNADKHAFKWIQKSASSVAASALKIAEPSDPEVFLNEIHNLVDSTALNDFRLTVIQGLNALPEFRFMYFPINTLEETAAGFSHNPKKTDPSPCMPV